MESMLDNDSYQFFKGSSGDDQLVSLDDEFPATNNYTKFKTMMRRAIETSDKQEARGHTKFFKNSLKVIKAAGLLWKKLTDWGLVALCL